MIKRFFAILIISLGSLSAQSFSGKLNPFPEYSPKNTYADSIKILAVMVNFQEDKDGTTFGNGKFSTIYSKDYGNKIIDPLPHNKKYFEAHLEFAKNYYRKVSGGKVNVSYTVLPDTFSVSKTMRNYSPANNSTDFALLADFASEVWTKADQLYSGFDFSKYDLFVIFHAGVGRDLSLPGSLGNEKDLPSVYLGENALKKIRGNSFTGFPVSGGNFKIFNSMIVPETESRELSSLGSTILFEISINGLIVANIASHLGLPDLFDTKTGLSAIGRFGLMDGQSIFAYNGLFPPEPSAWEKIFLGWADPVTVSPGNYKINLTVKRASVPGDTVILKIPISSSEYFLIENRNRDANGDGAILTLLQNDQLVTKVFKKDTSGFYSFSVDSVDGVLVDIDDFDWSLPGVIDDTASYKGGILIWHIDENIIKANILNNSINNDKKNRGVYVEEADGIQDIGETFTTIFGDQVIGEGSYEDYWYNGNPAKLFKNRFDKNSRPNSNSNTGANSLISINNFSGIGNKISFNLAFGDSIIKPVLSSSISASGSTYKLNRMNNNTGFNLLVDSDLYRLSNSGIVLNNYPKFSKFKTLSFSADNKEFSVGGYDTTLNILENGLILRTIKTSLISTPIVFFNTNSKLRLAFGATDSKVYFYDYDASNPNLFIQAGTIATNGTSDHIAAENNYYAVSSSLASSDGGSFIIKDSDNNSYTGNGLVHQLAITKNRNGDHIIIASAGSSIIIYSKGNKLSQVQVNSGNTTFSIADLKNNGENYILFTDKGKLNAVNLSGASAEGFPVSDPNGKNFEGTPLTADFYGNPNAEVITYSTDGRVFAFEGYNGKVVDGFPLTAGLKIFDTPMLYVLNGQASLMVIDSSRHIYGWNICSTEGKFFWSEENGNNSSSSFVTSASSSNFVNAFFPKDKVYNYPNPVYSGQTAIRFYVSENSHVNVKIFDIAGDFVAELNKEAAGGLESEIMWDITNIQSGIYLARVEAAGANGKTEQNIIKIAVVK